MKGLAHARLGRVGPYRSQKGWVGKAWTCLCRPAGLFTDLVLSEVPLTCFPVGCYSAFFVDGRFCLIQWFFTCFSGFRLQSLTGSGPVFLRVETFLSGIILCLGLVIRLILTGISLVIASLPFLQGPFFSSGQILVFFLQLFLSLQTGILVCYPLLSWTAFWMPPLYIISKPGVHIVDSGVTQVSPYLVLLSIKLRHAN